jgi:hypothetical protein
MTRKDNKQEILGPILDEMDEIRAWMERNTFAPMKEFAPMATRYAVLTVRLRIVQKW